MKNIETNIPKDMETAINNAIARCARSIRDLVSLGWTLEAATENARNASTFGPKSWKAVLELIK